MRTPRFDVKILVEKVRIVGGYLRYARLIAGSTSSTKTPGRTQKCRRPIEETARQIITDDDWRRIPQRLQKLRKVRNLHLPKDRFTGAKGQHRDFEEWTFSLFQKKRSMLTSLVKSWSLYWLKNAKTHWQCCLWQDKLNLRSPKKNPITMQRPTAALVHARNWILISAPLCPAQKSKRNIRAF